MRSPLAVAVGSLAVAVALASPARADIVFLENGSKVEGEIIREDANEVEIKGRAGSVVLQRSEIKSIEKRLVPDKEFAARREKLKDDDVPGRVALAEFALDKRLPASKAAELALEAFALDRRDPAVVALLRKRLDYHFEKSTWIAPDSWYPDHGWVKHQGSWVTLEQAAVFDSETLGQQARAESLAAERALTAGEKDVTTAQAEATKARHEIERIKGIIDSIDAKVTEAQADAQAAAHDLAQAQDQLTTAQRDYNYLSSQPTPTDPKQQDALNKRIALAQGLVDAATANQNRAQRRADAAQATLADLLDLKAQGPKRLATAQSNLDAAVAKEKTARDALPGKREAAAAAKKAVDEARLNELNARTKAADRRAVEQKADADREDSLRAYQLGSAPAAAEAPAGK